MTRPFAGVERFLERLLERPAARLFRTRLQPVQLQRRVERTLESSRVFNADRIYVPNRYRVLLNPTDLETFEGYRATLEADLAEAVLRRARARGYRLVSRPQVLLAPSFEVAEGDIEVVADLLDPSLVRSAAAGLRPVDLAGPRPPRPSLPGTAPVPILAAASGTTVAAPPPSASSTGPGPPSGVVGPPIGMATIPAVVEATAIIEVSLAGGGHWSHEFRGGAVRIGRAPDNEIVLVDDRVSRRHGQLSSRQGTLVYTDLGSSNGSFVNGTRAREIVLGDGDVVRLGHSTLTVRRRP